MSYCTDQDVRLALAPLAQFDDKATAAELSDEQIDDAIAEAEGIVDLYLTGYEVVPFEFEDDTDPDNIIVYEVAYAPIRGLTRNIAAWLATISHRKNKDLDENDPIRLRYDLTMSILNDILSGKLVLPPDHFPSTVGSAGVYVENLYEGKMFTMADVGLEYVGVGDVQKYVSAWVWEV